MEKNKSKNHFVYLGLILAIGFVVASFVLGVQFKNLRQGGVVTVKGLSEVEYKASLATMSFYVSVSKMSADQAYKEAKEGQEKLLAYLLNNGFNEDELSFNRINIVEDYDYQFDEKKERDIRVFKGYLATARYRVSTRRLDFLQDFLEKQNEFLTITKSITFTSPNYYLENLEQIKLDMIAQATKDARKRAEEFANNGGGTIGIMRSASQGAFNIYANTDNNTESDYGGSYDTSTIDKKVRLVVTVQYEIN